MIQTLQVLRTDLGAHLPRYFGHKCDLHTHSANTVGINFRPDFAAHVRTDFGTHVGNANDLDT